MKKLKVGNPRKLKNGDVVLQLDGLNKSLKDTLYKAALLDNTLSVGELQRQSQLRSLKTFKDVVISAFIVQALTEYLDRGEG